MDLIKKFKTPIFRKYVVIGVFLALLSIIISTIFLYIGREIFNISLVYLNPIISVFMFIFGFLLKYLLYDKWDMLKD